MEDDFLPLPLLLLTVINKAKKQCLAAVVAPGAEPGQGPLLGAFCFQLGELLSGSFRKLHFFVPGLLLF